MYDIRLTTSAKHTYESLRVKHIKNIEVEIMYNTWHSSIPKPYAIQR